MELQKEIRGKEQHFHVVLGSSGALGIILYDGELKLEGVCVVNLLLWLGSLQSS